MHDAPGLLVAVCLHICASYVAAFAMKYKTAGVVCMEMVGRKDDRICTFFFQKNKMCFVRYLGTSIQIKIDFLQSAIAQAVR